MFFLLGPAIELSQIVVAWNSIAGKKLSLVCLSNIVCYRLQVAKTTSGVAALICTNTRWKSVCVPNFDEISQSAAEIKLLPVSGFLKTGGHIVILFRFRFSSLACHSASTYAILSNVNYTPGRVMMTYPLFTIDAGSHIGFDLGIVRPLRKCNFWSKRGPQIWSRSD